MKKSNICIFIIMIIISSSRVVFADNISFEEYRSFFLSGYMNKSKSNSLYSIFCMRDVKISQCKERVSYLVAQRYIDSNKPFYENMAYDLVRSSDGGLSLTEAETRILKELAEKWQKEGGFYKNNHKKH